MLEKYLKKWVFIFTVCDWLYLLLGLWLIMYIVVGEGLVYNLVWVVFKLVMLIHGLSSVIVVLGDYVYDKKILSIAQILVYIIGLQILIGIVV